MRTGTLAFLLGVLLLQQFGTLPPVALVLGLLPLIPLALFLKFPWHLPAWLLGGFLWALWIAHQLLAQGLSPALEGQDLLLEGQVAGLPVVRERHLRFEFDVRRARLGDRVVPFAARIRLNWYGRYPDLAPGQPWRLTVRLKAPHGFRNPGGFDYEGWLFQHRIRATGYVRARGINESVGVAQGYPVQRLRHVLRGRIQAVLVDSPVQGLLLALVIGDRGAISPAQWHWLQQTGTNHLMAISGLHIGLVAGLAFLLGQWLWRVSGRGLLWLPAPAAGAVLALLAALGYAALAGFSIPTQRALIMVAVTMLALLRRRPVTPTVTLARALLLVLLLDPLAVLAAGFWLSFAAVALIFLLLGGHLERLPRWQQALRVQLGLSLGLFPLVLGLFQRTSLVAPLANLVAVPAVGLLVVPLALLGCGLLFLWPAAGAGLLQIGAVLLEQLARGLAWLGGQSWAGWSGSASPLALGLAGLGLLVLLLPRGVPHRWLGGILLLPLLLPAPSRLAEGRARFTLLDVGQGLAAVVQTRHHVLVFDTGPRFGRRFDTGQAVLVPFLRQAGLRQVDMLILSHGDSDHIGGARSLRSALPIQRILGSDPARLPDWPITPCRRGQHWEWDGVRFSMLHPDADTALRRNDASCVLQVRAGPHRLLLSADIERPAERRLLRRDGPALRADILVAPHHGSKTSSSAAFIAAVDPDFVLFPVGYRNRYGFPRPAVVARYRQPGRRLLDTARSGAIAFVLGAGALQATEYRQQARRYWHHH
jgi:competence protein ComEC